MKFQSVKYSNLIINHPVFFVVFFSRNVIFHTDDASFRGILGLIIYEVFY